MEVIRSLADFDSLAIPNSGESGSLSQTEVDDAIRDFAT